MSATGYTKGDPNKVSKAGDTMTGPLVLEDGSPAASEDYVATHGGGGGGGGPALSGTVVSETAFGQASSAGAASTAARGDHTHGTPPAPTAAGVGADPAGAASSAVAAHVGAPDPHGDRAYAAGQVAAHAAAVDPHGDRAYTDTQIAALPKPYTVLAFSQAGAVTATPGVARIYNDSGRQLTIRAVRASVGTAPAGASLIVDVKKSGVTIFTTSANRPAIAAGAVTSGKVTAIDVTALADGEYLTVDVAQVGSATAGSDLTVQIWAA